MLKEALELEKSKPIRSPSPVKRAARIKEEIPMYNRPGQFKSPSRMRE